MEDRTRRFHSDHDLSTASTACSRAASPTDTPGRSPGRLFGLPAAASPGVRATLSVVGIGRESTVLVGGRPAAILGYGKEEPVGEWLEVQILVELTPGVTTLELTSGGVTATPVSVTIDQYAPQISRVPADCSLGWTFKPGERAELYAIGLGVTNPIVSTGVAAPALPLAHTLVMPRVSFEGRPMEVLESVLAPGEVGIYRVRFKVPAAEGFYRLDLGMGEKISNGTPSVPVGNLIVHGSAPAHPSAHSDVRRLPIRS